MSSTNTGTASGAPAGSSAGTALGQKVKGAFQTAHGLGESIRGNAMDFVDSTFGTERGGHDATMRGQQEAEAGVANMEGHANAPVGTAPNQTTQTASGATQTTTAAPAQTLGNDVKQPAQGANVGAGVGEKRTGAGVGPTY